MKWFKHYSDASFDDKLQRIEGRLGPETYRFYFKIIELCAAQYDGISDNCVFFFSWVTLQNKVRMKRKQTALLLASFSELNFWKSESLENEVRIEFPKLLELVHKDSLNSKNRPVSGPPQARLDKIRRDKIRKEKKEDDLFDFNIPWQEYPNKIGKALGFKRLKPQIKTQKDFDDFCRAVRNYSKYVLDQKLEKKSIKHFQFFVLTHDEPYWRDWVAVEPSRHKIPKAPPGGF